MTRKPKQTRAITTVNAIIEAGFIAVADAGSRQVSTRQIADIAGISVGSLYEYFKNKEAIYDAMAEKFMTDVIRMVQPVLPTLAKLPADELIRTLMHRFRDLLDANDQRYRKCVRTSIHAQFHQYLEPISRVMMDLVMQYLMANPKLIRAGKIQTMSYIFISSGIYCVVRHVSDPAPPISYDEMTEGVIEMVMSYLEKASAGSHSS